MWTLWQKHRGLDIDRTDFNQEELTWSLTRIDFEQKIREAEAEPLIEPNSLKEFKKWQAWWEGFDGFCKMK